MKRIILCALPMVLFGACSDAAPTSPEGDEFDGNLGKPAAAFYPNPDIKMPGSAFSAISPGVAPAYTGECPWWVGGPWVFAAWDRPECEFGHGISPWVEYTATFSPGRWRIGLNAANYVFDPSLPGLGTDPTWYPEFEVGSSHSDNIIRIPASDTEWMHGYVDVLIWTTGPQTVRFWWLNDLWEGPEGRDANLIIRTAFFDKMTEMVYVDFKPGSCPNTINAGHRGVIPVAILGSATFDVTTVDPASARLGNVAPLRWSYEDVGTPYGSEPEDAYDCNTAGPDGYLDLSLKFDLQELIADDDDKPEDGDVGLVSVFAYLKAAFGGNVIEGADIVRVVVKNPRWEE